MIKFLISACLFTLSTLTANTAYVGGNQNIYAIDTETNSVIATIPLGTQPNLIAITPNNLFVYATEGLTDSVAVIDTSTNTLVKTISLPTGSVPVGIDITPDGKFAYVANQFGNTVSVISTATNQVVGTIGGFNQPWGIAITPDGRFAYVVNLSLSASPGFVLVIDLSTNTILPPIIPIGIGPTDIAIIPNGQYAYVTNETSNTVSVISTATNTIASTIPVGLNPFEVNVNPQGEFVYVSNNAYSNQSQSSISVIASDSNTVVDTIPLDSSGPADLAVTPDGLSLYVTNTLNIALISTPTNAVVGSILISLTSSIAITATPTLIAHLTGVQRVNDFGTEAEYFNHLHWESTPFSDVIGYNVYRNGILIASLNGHTFSYNDHNQRQGVAVTYAVAPIEASGKVSASLTVVVD